MPVDIALFDILVSQGRGLLVRIELFLAIPMNLVVPQIAAFAALVGVRLI